VTKLNQLERAFLQSRQTVLLLKKATPGKKKGAASFIAASNPNQRSGAGGSTIISGVIVPTGTGAAPAPMTAAPAPATTASSISNAMLAAAHGAGAGSEDPLLASIKAMDSASLASAFLNGTQNWPSLSAKFRAPAADTQQQSSMNSTTRQHVQMPPSSRGGDSQAFHLDPNNPILNGLLVAPGTAPAPTPSSLNAVQEQQLIQFWASSGGGLPPSSNQDGRPFSASSPYLSAGTSPSAPPPARAAGATAGAALDYDNLLLHLMGTDHTLDAGNTNAESSGRRRQHDSISQDYNAPDGMFHGNKRPRSW